MDYSTGDPMDTASDYDERPQKHTDFAGDPMQLTPDYTQRRQGQTNLVGKSKQRTPRLAVERPRGHTIAASQLFASSSLSKYRENTVLVNCFDHDHRNAVPIMMSIDETLQTLKADLKELMGSVQEPTSLTVYRFGKAVVTLSNDNIYLILRGLQLTGPAPTPEKLVLNYDYW